MTDETTIATTGASERRLVVRTVPGLDESFDAMPVPAPPGAESDGRAQAHHAGKLAGLGILHDRHGDYLKAVAEHERVRAAVQAFKSRLASIDEASRRIEPGSWWGFAAGAAGVVVCFGAEFGVSLKTLPYILNIDEQSLYGLAIAAAPPAAVAVFDLLLAELLERPWERLRLAARSWGRTVLWTVRCAVLTVAIVGNLFMLRDVARAREESMRADLAASSGDGVSAAAVIDRDIVNRAVLSVSIWVCLDGAFFMLLGVSNGRRLMDRRRAERELRSAQAEQASLERECSRLEAERGSCDRAREVAHQDAEHVEQLVTLGHLANLRRALDRQVVISSSQDRVRLALAGDRGALDAIRRTGAHVADGLGRSEVG